MRLTTRYGLDKKLKRRVGGRIWISLQRNTSCCSVHRKVVDRAVFLSIEDSIIDGKDITLSKTKQNHQKEINLLRICHISVLVDKYAENILSETVVKTFWRSCDSTRTLWHAYIRNKWTCFYFRLTSVAPGLPWLKFPIDSPQPVERSWQVLCGTFCTGAEKAPTVPSAVIQCPLPPMQGPFVCCQWTAMCTNCEIYWPTLGQRAKISYY